MSEETSPLLQNGHGEATNYTEGSQVINESAAEQAEVAEPKRSHLVFVSAVCPQE